MTDLDRATCDDCKFADWKDHLPDQFKDGQCSYEAFPPAQNLFDASGTIIAIGRGINRRQALPRPCRFKEARSSSEGSEGTAK